MAAGDVRIGLNADFRFGTAGTQATGQDTGGVVIDCSVGVKHDKTEITKRTPAATPTPVKKAERPIKIAGSASMTCMDVEGDTLVSTFIAAAVAGTKVAIYPKRYLGGPGLDADCYVEFDDEQPQDKNQIKFTLSPTNETRDWDYH